MSSAVLLIMPEVVAGPVTECLRGVLAAVVTVAHTQLEGLGALRRAQFDLVLIEESITAGDSQLSDLLYDLAGSAAVLEVNLAISGTARLLRQIRAALAKRVHDQTQARAAVLAELRNELSAGLTGILLEAQLALRSAPPEQSTRMRLLVGLAEDLRGRLRPELV